MRIPVSRMEDVRRFLSRPKAIMAHAADDVEVLGRGHWPTDKVSLPLFASKVPAGFPSPADDYAEGVLDLNEYLVEHEAATFYVRVKGNSMTGAGILDGDIIAVDRALDPRHGDVVVAVVDGELTVKELSIQGGQVKLVPHHPDYQPLALKVGQDFQVWGVVKGVVRKLR